MAATHVYAGAARSMEGTLGGVFRQTVGDTGWEHLTGGLPEGTEVHAITVHPENPETVYIGTTKGTYRSTNRGSRWQRLNLPDPEADIWSVCIHPKNPRIVYAGATPPGVYRSDDGGDTWRKMADPGLPDRVIMAFACRVMRLDIDPNSPDDVYATLEANGAMRSRNGGESWEDCTADLIRFCEQPKYRSRIGSQTEIEGMLDGHALACSAAAPGTVFLANRMGLFRSDNRGETWQDVEIGRFSPLTYGRDIRVSPHDPKVLLRLPQPGGPQHRWLDLPFRRCRPDLEAVRSRHQGRGDDDGRRRASARPKPGLRRVAVRPGLRHPGRRQKLARASAPRGGSRRLRRRLRMK